MASIGKRDQYNSQSLGGPLNRRVKEAKILMVGAGGIGCELLKNLVLSGFGEVHIVDLDTIDLSNLNRQFLFRHEHIKKSKALVAKDAAHKFNPNVKLEAHHANIKDPQFNVDWFKGFTMVFNALDNLDARRHVNKMCLAADVPLIESGTTGFNGQVQVIKKGLTACYDCSPKETPKSFPVCTIRSTPSQPIHCIVWGKSYLLSEVFGASEDETPEMDHSEDSENAKEIEKLRQESQALKQIKEAMGSDVFPQLLFDKVYKDDIIRLRSMEEMWKTRRPPEPVDYASTMEKAVEAQARKQKVLKDGQKVWSLEENLVVFKDSLERLGKRMAEMRSSTGEVTDEPSIIFDKDDEDTLDFVTASANLRSIVFGIETKSRFDIKQMAGNIIPAIATTNAIVAGLCVLESFKVIDGKYNSTKEIFLSPFAPERLLASDRLRQPDPDCPVCGVAQTRLLVDMSRATLEDLVEDFLRVELGYGEEIVINFGDNLLYDVEETDNLSKKLSELGIKSDSFLTVIDEDEDNPRVNLVLNVQESTVVDGKPIKSLDITVTTNGDSNSDSPHSPIPRKKKSQKPASDEPTNGTSSKTNGSSYGVSNGTGPSLKRSAADALGEDIPFGKKTKQAGDKKDDDVIILEDTDGAILID
ncbi:probable NEDD8-activating enzyme E1 catalytic subunit [Rhynchosporium secalis]|uniref:Ubiquitin-activating enzyme E1-like n=1 Tax=Rhynchosporium secalis TaxID=38038 RepID=A0A1E1MQ99_RHYSE|nr:probable NEDD8-activating enzyme E1 catalytic subunit [Rhynchosporium secalis]